MKLGVNFRIILNDLKRLCIKKFFFFSFTYLIIYFTLLGNYTFLIAKFTFSRRLSSAIFKVYVPSTLIVLLSWISFWVDVEAVPARITLGVTSLLTLTTQIVQAHSGLPPISYMTAMDIWLFGCLIAVFSVLVEYAFAYQFFILIKQARKKTTLFKVINIENWASYFSNKI